MVEKYIEPVIGEMGGMKLILTNGEELEQLIKKAQELNLKLADVNLKLSQFKPVWRLRSLTQD